MEPVTPDDREPLTRIDKYLRESGIAARDPTIVPLTGDASDRRYFRVTLSDGESLVLAVHADPFTIDTLAFANVAELFAGVPLPIPAILGHRDRDGILILQDLGNVTLQLHLGSAAPVARAALYREAVSFIERLQQRGAELESNRYVPYRMALDFEKLTWELDFFVRHFLEGYRSATLTPPERVALGQEWRMLAEELAGHPRVLCHRDYHSRNLMLHGAGLYIIDFQDARMGPDTYDLASLLRDSYVEIGDRELDEYIGHFLALKQSPEPAQGFRQRFDLMTLQRNLKALGTFGYQTTARGNPVYTQYMPRTIDYALTNLRKHPRFARLRELLARHLEELK